MSIFNITTQYLSRNYPLHWSNTGHSINQSIYVCILVYCEVIIFFSLKTLWHQRHNYRGQASVLFLWSKTSNFSTWIKMMLKIKILNNSFKIKVMFVLNQNASFPLPKYHSHSIFQDINHTHIWYFHYRSSIH